MDPLGQRITASALDFALEASQPKVMARNTSIMPKQEVTSSESAEAPHPKQPQQESYPRCAFLELPRELRDEIYKHVMHPRSVTLKQRNLITQSGLVGTNNQIREEFLDAVLFYAPVIHTTVLNHNFAHVVTFLNRLSEAQLAWFKKSNVTTIAKPRKIRITLTYGPTKQSTRPQLNRWLNRFDDPNRRGAEIRFSYTLDRSTWRNGGYKQKPQSRVNEGPGASEQRTKMLEALRALRHNGGW
ncbi:hypothetical protein ACN47E_010212 [Coniothyrium glycines]